MFKFTVLTSFIALLCTDLGQVDARVVAAAARETRTDDVIKKSTLVQRDVVSPPITYPTTGTVWNVGERHNCTWDTSVIPPGFTSTGMIVLGYLDDADGDNEHLDLDNPLAKGFPITNGRAEITVPSVTNRNTYILVLFGDSGNASGKFTIKNISIVPPSSSSSSAAETVTQTASSVSSAASSSTEGTSLGSSSVGSTNATSPQTTSTGSFNLGGINGTGTDTTAKPTSTGLASLTSSAPAASKPASSASPASAAADGATPSTTNTSAAARSASFGGAAAWISTVCSLAIVLGWAI